MILKNALRYFFSIILVYFSVLYIFNSIYYHGVPFIYRTSDYLVWKGGNTFQKFMEYNPDCAYDILVLGSSHAYRGYDPRLFEKEGYSMFNLGTSGQTILNTYFIATNYIHKKPKLVLLDVYEGAFVSDGFESGADIIQNVSSNKVALEMALALQDIRSVNMIALRGINRFQKPCYVDSNYVGKGFSQNTDSLKKLPTYEKKATVVVEKQWQYFQKMLHYFHERGIKVIAVNHPSANMNNKMNHEHFWVKLRAELALYNIPFWDYTYKIQLNPTDHFYDHTHLNQSGVLVFNEVLLHDLKMLSIK